MPEPFKAAVDFDFGANGGKFHFTTLEEFEAWAEKEKAAWHWLEEGARSDGVFQRAWNVQSSPWNELRNRVDRVRRTPNNRPEHAESVRNLIAWLNDMYSRQHVVHSASARAKHVEELRKTDPKLAAYTLIYYQGVSETYSPKAHEGATLGVLQDYGIHDSALSEKQAVEALRQSLQAEVAQSRKDFAEFSAKTQAFQRTIESNIAANQAQFQNSQAEEQKTFATMMEKSKATLANLEKTYDQDLALHAPIRYWGAKAKTHKWFSISYSVGVLLAFVVVGEALYKTMRLVVGNAKFTETELWKIGLIAMIATLGVWVIRVLVRLLLSNLHLYTDAAERKTMMHTYLALLRKGHIPDGDERKLILQVLFRPSSTGIVKDDATPPFMAEWLKRITGHDA